MADDIVIRAEGLGKKYTIGHQSERERYTALRDVMARGARNLWRKTADLARGRAVVAGDRVEEFWALKDVSFEVRRGEVLGIIGRNGAGKSTLLKILSRITEPSEGRVTIKGRVASLLEVGTGFHPELTGRENIYLNGAILGMTRAEIRRKFDEIVDFAGVEKFLDTPVKRYSSGMYVRLAFAVAAHLEPEILVIDEVLAVGDAEFQKKCLGKMGEVAGGGRTVLFVSHNTSALQRLCSDALVLEGGQTSFLGNVAEGLRIYSKVAFPSAGPRTDLGAPHSGRNGSGHCRFVSFELADLEDVSADVFMCSQPFQVKVGLYSSTHLRSAAVEVVFVSETGNDVMAISNQDCETYHDILEGLQTFCWQIDPMILAPGRYFIRAAISCPGEIYDYVDPIGFFQVTEVDINSTNPRYNNRIGDVFVKYQCERSTKELECQVRSEAAKSFRL